VGRGGVLKSMAVDLDAEEAEQFRGSAAVVRRVLDQVM
jgi:hypothetical protein